MLSRTMIFLTVLLTVQVMAQSAMAATVKVVSKNNLVQTVSLLERALGKAEVPVLSNKKLVKSLPGGFTRSGQEITFSNPFFGWNLGECHRGLRKDKPMKAQVWTDASGVWIEYDQPEAFVNSFGVIECGNETDKVRRALSSFVDAATE